ncbi:hypothetical protein FQR65_LT08757 [Abscondita terminalis]|nr:hypothetical protein FQR65_LT08757 [Abscondita terminalis]
MSRLWTGQECVVLLQQLDEDCSGDAIDCVNLDKCLCSEIGDTSGATCVSVQFLDNPPLDICEDDFSSSKNGYDSCNVKSGKSCLFSLTPAQAEEAICQFDVYVTVLKKVHGIEIEKVEVGNSLISIVNLFNDLIQSLNSSCSQCSPSAKTLKDVFQITDDCGEVIGDIGMYIRMSCFGKLIVTQFQMNLEDKSVLFKDKEGHSLYRYKKAGKNGVDNQSPCRSPSSPSSCVCNDNRTQRPSKPSPPPTCRPPPCRPPPCVPPPCPPPPCPPPPCPPPPCPYPCTTPPCAPSPCPPPCPIQLPCTCAHETILGTENRCDRYHEIGASMGGNSLTIRVHKDKKCDEVCAEEESCGCGSISGKSRCAAGGGCQPREQSLAMRPGCDCTTSDGTSSPFALKLGNVPYGNNNCSVVPPVCTTSEGTQFCEVDDPCKDVFILRIGKKSEGCERKKNNLELELCTPKAPECPPPPRKESRDTQCEEEEKPKAKKKSKGKTK